MNEELTLRLIDELRQLNRNIESKNEILREINAQLIDIKGNM